MASGEYAFPSSFELVTSAGLLFGYGMASARLNRIVVGNGVVYLLGQGFLWNEF